MTVHKMIRDATTSLIDADRLADDLPREHQAAIRALISSLVGLARAMAESDRTMASRRVPDAELSFRRSDQPPLALGME